MTTVRAQSYLFISLLLIGLIQWHWSVAKANDLSTVYVLLLTLLPTVALWILSLKAHLVEKGLRTPFQILATLNLLPFLLQLTELTGLTTLSEKFLLIGFVFYVIGVLLIGSPLLLALAVLFSFFVSIFSFLQASSLIVPTLYLLILFVGLFHLGFEIAFSTLWILSAVTLAGLAAVQNFGLIWLTASLILVFIFAQAFARLGLAYLKVIQAYFQTLRFLSQHALILTCLALAIPLTWDLGITLNIPTPNESLLVLSSITTLIVMYFYYGCHFKFESMVLAIEVLALGLSGPNFLGSLILFAGVVFLKIRKGVSYEK